MRNLALIVLAAAALAGCAGTASRSEATPGVMNTADWTPEPTMDPDEPDPTPTAVVRPTSYATLNKRSWQKVVKSPDQYVGKAYKLVACVYQFDAATGDAAFMALASYRKPTYWADGDNAAFTGEPNALADVLKGDIVSLSVVVLGSYSYDTQAGGNTTVPSFQVMKIKREKGSCE